MRASSHGQGMANLRQVSFSNGFSSVASELTATGLFCLDGSTIGTAPNSSTAAWKPMPRTSLTRSMAPRPLALHEKQLKRPSEAYEKLVLFCFGLCTGHGP